MTDAIIVALITGACAIAAQLIISKQSAKDLYAELDKRQAVTDTKMDELTREVRAHNGHAERIVALETRVQSLERRAG
jgi:hypothetical protein